MAMKPFLLQFFTWWSGQTIGTRFFTWRFGERVGEDEFGNVYYQTAGGKIDPTIGVPRRWVVYKDRTEATLVPAGWLGWLRNTQVEPPSVQPYTPREWERPHQPNMTGTPFGYRPKGSILNQNERPAATGDYDAWSPGGAPKERRIETGEKA
ncbi:NADH dehydrogenase [Alsobacter metallidurans]|uniref:NADH dehydrogenase n=2 Tax=Alsobacter metallidurans TaxID=340221 RepID=A0A917MJC2_9HYPH|nr:NADH dehydrogenase [Alsobacter metallidurans]